MWNKQEDDWALDVEVRFDLCKVFLPNLCFGQIKFSSIFYINCCLAYRKSSEKQKIKKREKRQKTKEKNTLCIQLYFDNFICKIINFVFVFVFDFTLIVFLVDIYYFSLSSNNLLFLFFLFSSLFFNIVLFHIVGL